jgi:hypothetical protein
MTTATNAEVYIKVIRTTITRIIIFKDIRIILNVLIVFRIAVVAVPLALAKFAAGIVVVPKSTYYKSKSKRRITLDTGIAINFHKR